MQVKVEKKYGSILKLQRPKMTGKAKSNWFLIYTRDGKLPPMLVPDVGDFAKALGNRLVANFACTIDGATITLGNEVYCQD